MNSFQGNDILHSIFPIPCAQGRRTKGDVVPTEMLCLGLDPGSMRG